jgi:hypothetical protein
MFPGFLKMGAAEKFPTVNNTFGSEKWKKKQARVAMVVKVTHIQIYVAKDYINK